MWKRDLEIFSSPPHCPPNPQPRLFLVSVFKNSRPWREENLQSTFWFSSIITPRLKHQTPVWKTLGSFFGTADVLQVEKTRGRCGKVQMAGDVAVDQIAVQKDLNFEPVGFCQLLSICNDLVWRGHLWLVLGTWPGYHSAWLTSHRVYPDEQQLLLHPAERKM